MSVTVQDGLGVMSRFSKKQVAEGVVAPGVVRRVRRALLDWYDANKRDLPWRRTGDPYAILISEFMLQQTQVQTALPYYQRFLSAFPTVASLANADEEEVLREWAGLGYYSRARNLHAAAKKIVEEFGGKVPGSYAELLFLPGVGPYAAGAIASIAFGAAVPAVDANVIRVLSRLFVLPGLSKSPSLRKRVEEAASALVSPDRAGDFNQALMELGALVCRAASPKCEECPLAQMCKGFASGEPERYPAVAKRKRTVRVEELCVVARRHGQVLLVKGVDRYRNMYEFPHWEAGGKRSGVEQVKRYLKREFGLRVVSAVEWADIRHQVTHHNIHKLVYLCDVEGDVVSEDDERWVSVEEAADLPLGAPYRKILGLLADQENDLFAF